MKKREHAKTGFSTKPLLTLSVALAIPAMAQESRVLEEVVVTAEHREASLQDTQISISAFSSQDIQDMGISNTTDLAHAAPNIVINSFQGGKSGVSVNMRGMAQNETLVTFDPAIGVYIDDVLISKNVGAMLDVVDMERIEILRGPQGTLYGRNTMGGTLNYVTKKPVDEFEGSITATVGKYGQRDLKGVINAPLLDANSEFGTLNMRLSAAAINRDGLTDNNLTGAPDGELETKDRKAALLHLMWEPTDDIKVLYSYDWTRIDEVPGTPWTTNVNLERTVGTLLQPFAIGRVDRPDSIMVNGPHVAETDVDGHSLHIDYAISESLTFKSITAMREMENFSTADADGSPISIMQTIDTNINDQFTQEFRLVGTAWDNRLDFTVGLFYMDEEGKVDQILEVFTFPERSFAEFENKNWALYGQATYALTDQWRVTAGVRYTEEEREMSKFFYPRTGGTVVFPDAKGDFDNISPMVSISYDWNEDVMSYFKVSTGFQSGGFNVRDANPTTFVEGFDEETLLAYEVGIKADIDDRIRLNTALWYSDYDDKRVNNFDPETVGNVVRNAGVVEIYGAEIELLAQLNEHFRLGVNYGYTKPEYKKYDSPNPDNPSEILDLSDSTNFLYTPENTAGINLTYEYQLAVGLLRARVDWAYKDDYNFLAPQPERNSQESYDIWNARVTLDDIGGPGDIKMRVSLWGKNLTDESYYYNGVNIYETFGFDINLYAEPRTYGLDVDIRF